jgi:hypothetical protein
VRRIKREQLGTQALFKPAHRTADRRRRDTQGQRGSGKALQLGCLAKHLDASQLHGVKTAAHSYAM